MGRTDNDTWDVATSVGATATMVAAGRARATATDDPLIEDRFAGPLVQAVGIDFFTRWAAGELDPADVDDPDASWGLQQMTHAMAVRTRYIDEFFLDATAAGIRQAVILASGLDARAYRLSWPPDTTVFEIDQPEVLDFKTTTLAGLSFEPTATLQSVPVDLRHDWPAALQAAGFDTEQPTAWAAEGLLAYLPPQAQDRLLDNITALSALDSRLAANTFWDTPESQKVGRAAFQRWYECGLDVKLDDLCCPGARNDVATYLTGRGWHVDRAPFSQLLADHELPAAPPKSTDNYCCTAILRGSKPSAHR
ncbi:class I SAM-dependent methyltransferase [Candidatus Mycobacterium methanotrophicum]|uniref:S-adenosyl-L-methionine-dependent methyltransferase n=1 Tax=Candidatus Mycobacterium methanotrophicum TaxID=2943498 RepID=A0ABY4QP51_9MYCO|nr:class I SAM-dependent methyltransferase [Candidatus Mycobacterium methanotrophicum]UQX12785.1 class I SAM-dependent methyltransferase [Candidatus Mycobacterium methanotrophicum]